MSLKKLLHSKKLIFIISSLLLVFGVLFADIPIGFSNILFAGQMSGFDDEGRPLYMHYLEEEEIEIAADYSANEFIEPSDFETKISQKISTFDLDEWNLILVNKDNPLEEDVDCQLKNFDGFDVDERIYDELDKMFSDAKEDGVNLFMASGYRNYNTQSYLYEKKINYYKKGGFSLEEATAIASMKVTPPLTSEHETGLAVDILSYDYSDMDSGFGESKAGNWLRKNSFKYGFILRYDEGKEDITKIQYEPWHFRYVGYDAAEFIYINNLSFEEFHDMVLEYEQ